MEICDVLNLSEPFNSIPNAVLNKIGAIAELVTYKKGAVVYKEGDEADAIYVILSGKVSRTISPPISYITEEKFHQANDVVGWVSLFQDMPYGLETRICTLVCVEDSAQIKIDSRKFEALLEGEGEVRVMLRERHAGSIADSLMLPGGAVGFTYRGNKKIPVFVPNWRVNQLLNNNRFPH